MMFTKQLASRFSFKYIISAVYSLYLMAYAPLYPYFFLPKVNFFAKKQANSTITPITADQEILLHNSQYNTFLSEAVSENGKYYHLRLMPDLSYGIFINDETKPVHKIQNPEDLFSLELTNNFSSKDRSEVQKLFNQIILFDDKISPTRRGQIQKQLIKIFGKMLYRPGDLRIIFRNNKIKEIALNNLYLSATAIKIINKYDRTDQRILLEEYLLSVPYQPILQEAVLQNTPKEYAREITDRIIFATWLPYRESGYQPHLKGADGEAGLIQLMEPLAKHLGIKTPDYGKGFYFQGTYYSENNLCKDPHLDERINPVVMLKAFKHIFNYMNKLPAEFSPLKKIGLTIICYNAGQGTADKIFRKNRTKLLNASSDQEFLDILKINLNKITARYIDEVTQRYLQHKQIYTDLDQLNSSIWPYYQRQPFKLEPFFQLFDRKELRLLSERKFTELMEYSRQRRTEKISKLTITGKEAPAAINKREASYSPFKNKVVVRSLATSRPAAKKETSAPVLQVWYKNDEDFDYQKILVKLAEEAEKELENNKSVLEYQNIINSNIIAAYNSLKQNNAVQALEYLQSARYKLNNHYLQNTTYLKKHYFYVYLGISKCYLKLFQENSLNHDLIRQANNYAQIAADYKDNDLLKKQIARINLYKKHYGII